MLAKFLQNRGSNRQASGESSQQRYEKLKRFALLGVSIAYAGHYIARNKLTFWTLYLNSEIKFSKQDIGFISATTLISYGLAKGYGSVLADRCDPKRFLALGLMLSAPASSRRSSRRRLWCWAPAH